MMKNCQEIARLVSEGRDRELSFYQRLSVRMHLAMCSMCRRFAKQLDFIGRLTRMAGRTGSLLVEGGILDQRLSPDAKSRIKQELSRRNS